jgi:hypothetical protein
MSITTDQFAALGDSGGPCPRGKRRDGCDRPRNRPGEAARPHEFLHRAQTARVVSETSKEGRAETCLWKEHGGWRSSPPRSRAQSVSSVFGRVASRGCGPIADSTASQWPGSAAAIVSGR